MKCAAWILAGVLLATYAYFHHDGGFNQHVRFDLTRALVERGTIVIDAYHHNTLDKAYRDGHYYCDKPPGASFAGAPGYWVARRIAARAGRAADDPVALRWGFYLARITAAALPGAALGVVLLCTIWPYVPPVWAALVAVGLGLGTLVFPYSVLFYGHQLAATGLFAAFAVLFVHRREGPRRPAAIFGAGVAAGLAGAADYPAFLVAAALGVYALSGPSRLSTATWFAAGVGLPALGLAAYHTAAFGAPFSTGFAHEAMPFWRGKYGAGFYGMGWPRTEAVYQLTIGSRRGLFYNAPWLALALPGLWGLARVRGWRAEAMLVATATAVLLWFNAGLQSWDGGWTLGARYLLPAVPFLAFAAAFADSHRLRQAGAVLVAVSVFLMLAATAVKPEVPVIVPAPLGDFVLPYFLAGKLSVDDPHGDAFNLGELLFGLQGLASLVPLAALWLAGAAALAWAVRRGRTGA
jgi:hypothetical protein